MSTKNISNAGQFLLAFLRSNPDGTNSARFSFLFDGTESSRRHLSEWIGVLLQDHPTPEFLVLAAGKQLEEAGIVTIAELPQVISGGSHDLLLRLTDLGVAFVNAGEVFRFKLASD